MSQHTPINSSDSSQLLLPRLSPPGRDFSEHNDGAKEIRFREMRSTPLRLVCAALGVSALTLLAGAAQAQINFVNMFRSAAYTQTANGNTKTLNGYYFSTSLFSLNGGDFGAVNVSYPGPTSPQSLIQQTPSYFLYQSGFFPTQAAMDAAYPMGTYAYTTSGGSKGAASTSYVYAKDDYPQSQPFLTGNDFTSLQGMNAGSAFTFHFSPFATGGKSTESFLFFTIYDNTIGDFVYDAGFTPATTPSITIGPNTLLASHNYNYELTFSNRDFDSVASPGAAFSAQIGFDYRTTGNFVTAAATAPEPGSLALLLPALGMVGMESRKQRRRRN